MHLYVNFDVDIYIKRDILTPRPDTSGFAGMPVHFPNDMEEIQDSEDGRSV
jgi:hypothetical protein